MEKSERLAELHREALDHVVKYGATNWAGLRDRFPDLEDADFWDELKWAQARHDQKLAPWPVGIADAVTVAQERTFVPPQREVGDVFQQHLAQHMADVERLKAACVDDQGQIQDRRTFTQTLKLQEQALQKWHEVRKETYDMDRARRLLREFRLVLETFAPEDQPQAISRLKRLNWAFGIPDPKT